MAQRRFLIAAALLGLAGAAPAAADADVFDALAADLLAQLKAHDPPRVAQMVMAKRRVAIWPFRRDDLPVGPAAADGFNDALLAALVRQADGRYAFVGRRELAPVIADLEQTGQGLDDPVAAIAPNARADVLILGALSPASSGLGLAYKAMGVAKELRGQVLAATQPRTVPMPEAGAGLHIDAALERLARELANAAADARTVRLAGIRYQATGIETPLARYLEERLVTALTAAYGKLAIGRAIAITRAALTAEQVARMRGVDAAPRDLAAANADKQPDAYNLSGSYWDFGDGVQLVVTLHGADGRTVAGTQHIAAASLPPGLARRPPADFQALRENDNLGDIKLTLSSDRGRHPSYRIGEKMNLLIRLGRTAWLYCYYLQADGATVRIFPNAHHRVARLDGGRLHTIPGELFPFDLNVTEPAGAELLKCFAANRDVAAELPAELRAPDSKLVPPALAQRLPLVFQALRNAEVSEASMVMTVVR